MPLSPETARAQLALMYVNPSQGITDVHLVKKGGGLALVVDILAPFWSKVGGNLPKTWGGLPVSVAIFDAAGGQYPDWVKLKDPGVNLDSVKSSHPTPLPPSSRRLKWAAFIALLVVLALLRASGII